MTIKIGFIGLGEHQLRAHLKHLIELKKQGYDIIFRGAFDPSLSAFSETKVSYGITLQPYASAEALLNADINTVFIASPDEFHTDQLEMAVTKGHHVFCEKPISQTSDDIVKLHNILNLAHTKGLVITTCHPRRFDPPFIYLKNGMSDLQQQFGDLKHFDFSFWYHEVTDAWKKNRSLLSDHFGHEIDIYRFLFGPPNIEVRKNSDSYDGYETTGVSDKGPSFRFFGSRALKENVYHETIRLDFQKASVFVFLNSGGGIVLPEGKALAFPKIDYDERFMSVNKNFIDTINGKAKNYLSEDDIICNNSLSVDLTEKGWGKYPPS